MATSIAIVKKELRKKIRAILSDLPESSAASQTANATRALMSMPEYKSAQRISVYLSMPGGEISTGNIVKDALEQGKTVFIPYTYNQSQPKEGEPRSIMDMLQLCSMEDLYTFQPDKWGIPTPIEGSIASRANCFGGHGITNGESGRAPEGLDLIVMPGMAFDVSFGRLGHGKGFYDYFLTRCNNVSRMPFRVGLSLTEQFLPHNESVPMDASDYRLDALIVGTGQIHRAASIQL